MSKSDTILAAIPIKNGRPLGPESLDILQMVFGKTFTNGFGDPSLTNNKMIINNMNTLSRNMIEEMSVSSRR